jgi:hypothetical protein
MPCLLHTHSKCSSMLSFWAPAPCDGDTTHANPWPPTICKHADDDTQPYTQRDQGAGAFHCLLD